MGSFLVRRFGNHGTTGLDHRLRVELSDGAVAMITRLVFVGLIVFTVTGLVVWLFLTVWFAVWVCVKVRKKWTGF